MATIADRQEAAGVTKKARKRKPLKNLSASDTNVSAGVAVAPPVSALSPLPPFEKEGKENREGLALLLSPTKAKHKAKNKNSSTAAELDRLQGMLEKLHIEKTKTEKLLQERDKMLQQKDKEIEIRCKEQKRLEEKVKQLQKIKEFKPTMSVPIVQSLLEKEEEEQKKKKNKKKPCAPYVLFSKDHWNEVKKENPEATFRDISTILGERWRKLSEEDRKPYEEMYQKEREEYLQVVGKERREEIAMKLLEEEQKRKIAMELLDQYIAFKQEAEKETTKTKKVRDPTKPKQPMTAFFLYSKERREALVAEGKNALEIAKLTGEEWRNMDEDKRAPYEETARKNKEGYFQILEDYKHKKAEGEERLQKSEEERMKILKQEALQLLKMKEKREEFIKKTKDKKSKQKEKKNASDPNKPKRPPSSFFLFSKEIRKSLVIERPHLQTSTLNALITVKWKELDSTERQLWVGRALEAMIAYKKEMDEYNRSLEGK